MVYYLKRIYVMVEKKYHSNFTVLYDYSYEKY